MPDSDPNTSNRVAEADPSLPVRAVDRIRTRWLAGIRIRRGVMQTSVVTLSRPGDGAVVHIVAMMHLGSAAYFRQVATLLAGYRGAGHIHYEWTRDRPEERQTASEAELDLLDRWNAAPNPTRTFARVLGLSRQQDLAFPPHAVNIDVSMLDTIQHLSQDRIEAMINAPDLNNLRPQTIRRIARLALRYLPAMRVLTFPFEHKATRQYLGQVRERKAFQAAATATFTGQPVCMVWGAAHLPRFVRQFEALGFTLTDIGWLNAVNLDQTRIAPPPAVPAS